MLREIQTYGEDAIGKYVLQSHLECFYSMLCTGKAWELRHCSVIGVQLGRLSDKAIVKRGGRLWAPVWFVSN